MSGQKITPFPDLETLARQPRLVRLPLEANKVYCHKCSGFGSIRNPARPDLKPARCSNCAGTGQIARKRFANSNINEPDRRAIHASNAEAGEAIECRMGVALSAEGNLPGEIMVMPGGLHQFTPYQDGKPIAVKLMVDPSAAAKLQAALEAHLAAGPQRPYFDFDHKKEAASAWPTGFVWRNAPQPGVYAQVEWSKAGAEAVQGKMYRAFSPTFFVDHVKANPAKVSGAPLNMGALVNEPAFKQISPLWAKTAEGAEKGETNMTPEELAALQARLAQLEKENRELKAKQASSENEAAIQAKQAEIDQLKQTVTKLEGELQARRKADAKTAVDAAVARGAIPAKDTTLQAKWSGLIESNPENAELLAKLPGNPALQASAARPAQTGAIQASGAGVERLREDPYAVLKAYAGEASPMDRGLIYARDISPRIKAGEDFPLILKEEDIGSIKAANSLGTVAAEVIVQRALELLRLKFPLLNRISKDFSGDAVKYGAEINTRIITIPSVVTYNTTTGYADSDATTTDVPVTINQHKAVQVSFQANELGGTSRDLFAEQAEAMAYALAKNFVDALYALFVIATYTNATTVATASLTRITGPIAMAKAMGARGVPAFMRTLLLNSDTYAKLAEDTSIVSLAANLGDAARAIQTGILPDVHGFSVIEAVNLPSTGNMTGFALFPSAAAIAARVPQDYLQTSAGNGAAVSRVITDPDTGLSLHQVQFVNHTLGRAYNRLAFMYGVAAGDANCGQILKSA